MKPTTASHSAGTVSVIIPSLGREKELRECVKSITLATLVPSEVVLVDDGAYTEEFLKELNTEDKITFLFATHDPVMMEYANRIVRLHDGKIIQDDTR